MWIMTPDGFTSTVLKEGGFQVRARDRRSLEHFARLAGIPKKRIVADYEERYRDYPYRVVGVAPDEMKRYAVAEIDAITYSNVKSEAKIRRGAAYAKTMGRVWESLLHLTPTPVWNAMVEADRRRAAELRNK